MRTCSIRWITRNLDSIRVPLNATERESRKGNIPYWGANRVVDYVDEALLDERVVLIGEDGAPFFDPLRDVAFLSEGPIWPNNHIHVLRADPAKVDDVYLVYCLNAVDYSRYINGATRDKLTQFQLGSIRISLPEIGVQRAIARYLDDETGHINDLIKEKSRFIDLLREKRVAKISQAVRRGLKSDVPMTPSGQDWLGDVPAHWGVVSAARLFDERDERSSTGDEELLTVSHLTGVTPRSEKTVHMIQAESHEGYKRCLPGDLVVNTLWAWMGAMGTAPMLGIVSPAYNVYTPRSELLNPRFVDYLVRVPVFAKEVTRFSKGVWSSRLRLYPEGFKEVRWPVPPVPEQEEIADHLDRETARIDGLISETERSIALLKEKRSALITAAVTGKIDVRSAA